MQHAHYQHTPDVLLYERRSLGDGKYYQRGIADMKEGDTFISFTEPKTVLTCTKVISTSPSQGRWKTPHTYFEAEFVTDNPDIHLTEIGFTRKIQK